MERSIADLQRLIAQAERILVFTGAGVSTGSNIPDYRGPQGVWQTQRPIYYQEFMANEASRIEYWRFKLDGYPAFRDALPNAAHRAIVELERLGKLLLLVTQNIDGLHRQAGSPLHKLVELHGTGSEAVCVACARREPMAECLARFEQGQEPPRCGCGELMKPAVVMFGEGLDGDDLRRAFAAARQADLVLSLGSSLTVTPAADVPLTAARRGVPYAIVNRGSTPHDELATVTIDGDVCEVLPLALAAETGSAV